MDEALDIFNPNSTLKKIVLPCPKSRRRPSYDGSIADSDLNTTIQSETGTEYVTEYIQKEEKELLESANHVYQSNNHGQKFDDVSQGTVPSLAEINSEDLTKIYRTYNFAYRPDSSLAIMSMKDRIMAMIDTNPVVVIEGSTGCGKTTQVPQFILDSCFRKKLHCNIIVTQPRRIAAVSIAKRVSQERGWPVGTLVGYQVGMLNNTSKDTRLTYCTTGVLLHKLIRAKHMLDYTHVILDEVHERDQEMDFLLIVVRRLLRTNSRNVKVVLMSATFDVEKFSKYFSSPICGKLEPAPIMEVTKPNCFKINMFYLYQIDSLGPFPEVSADQPKASEKMMVFCINIILCLDDIDKEMSDMDSDEPDRYERHVVLIFLPGIHEIEEMHNLLTAPKHDSAKLDIIILHSMITSEDQQRIFESPPEGYRRVILSTNVAESSITVPDVKYVIDFCLTKQLVTDPTTNFQCLELTWASKTNCEQRAGRTGRVMDGRVYRLVPKSFYDKVLPNEAPPEMLRAPLENLVLKAKQLDMGEPKAILALSLDPPDLHNLERTILLLKEAGALLNRNSESQPFDGELTDLGRVMANLPVDIHISKFIMLGRVFSVLRDAIIIGASMAVKDMFCNPFKKKILAYNVKLSWAGDSCSDLIAFLHVYKVWLKEKANRRISSNALEKKWAQRNFVQIKVLREVDALVQDITIRLRKLGIIETVGVNRVVWDDIQRPLVLKIAIAGAFYPNYFVPRAKSTEDEERGSVKLLNGLDPMKTVYLQGWPFTQPGMLYARRIQELFEEHCLSSSIGQVHVSFDESSRVYVQFSKTDNNARDKKIELSNEIPVPVYRAIKMRLSGIPVQVPVLKSEDARRRADQMNIAMKKVPDTFHGKSTLTEKTTSPPYARPQLPGFDTSYIPIRILHIIDPGHFWSRTRDASTFRTLGNMERAIHMRNEDLKPFASRPNIGTLVLAPNSQANSVQYRRAIIEGYLTNVDDTLTKVLFIDYGYTHHILFGDLREPIEDLNLDKVPGLAFECVLANVQPSIVHNLNGQWSQAADHMFKDLLSHSELFGEVYSVVNGVVALKLVCINISTKVKIDAGEFLIEKEVATWKEESYLSRLNHEMRQNNTDVSEELLAHFEEMQYDHNSLLTTYPDPPSISECTEMVKLRGPFSPLEVTLLNMTYAGKNKKANIEANSVNCVLLDPKLGEPHDYLLVAGSISQGKMSNNLTLRHTTLMPKIPGLMALLSLIFTPYTELRRSNTGSRYIGALCGLGVNTVTNGSIFPEHDMEVNFDVEITMDDLQEVNKLRHWMNVGMHINDAAEDANIEETLVCQNRIKDVLIKLIFEKQRKPQKVQSIDNFGMWNRYDESLFLQPGRAVMVRNVVYRLHYALELVERNDDYEMMLAHAEELRALAIEDPRKGSSIECKFCNTNILSIPNLRGHLYTPEHNQNEKRFGISV